MLDRLAARIIKHSAGSPDLYNRADLLVSVVPLELQLYMVKKLADTYFGLNEQGNLVVT